MNTSQHLLVYIAIFFLLWAFIKYFERKNVYFPTREIEGVPEDIGLKYQDIYFETKDGIKLNGWFVPAEDATGTVLFCHGNGGNISHRLGSINVFHQLKFNVFIFDYRGYGRSKGRVSEKGTYRDALAAHQYITSRQDVDKENIIIFGRSLGGAIAIDVAGKIRARALIVESTFTSIKDIGKEIYPFLPIGLIVELTIEGAPFGIKELMNVKGEIHYCNFIKSSIYNCGIKFVDIPEKHKKAINQFIVNYKKRKNPA